MLAAILNIYRWLFAHEFFYGLNKLLYRCSLSGLGILNYQSDRISGEHRFVTRLLENKPDGIVLDVGANVGAYSKAIAEINPRIKIFAFEPHPLTYKHLCKNAAGINVETLNVAAGEREGTLTLFDYVDRDGSSHASVYRDVIEGIHQARSIAHDVNVITLDEFLASQGINHVFLLKIDTEGHELSVLKGAKESIANGKIEAIQFEFNEMNISSRTFFRDFWELLPNYELYRLLPDGMARISKYSPVFCEIFAYQNIVAKLKQPHRS
jgi:FkbM family methyltransferase